MTQTLKKSTELEKPVKGYADKCLAYREAWTRIKEAQEQGFYLEAITIEESIISDRLNSYFRKVILTDKQFHSLKRIGDFWRKNHPDIIKYGDIDLITALDEWRIGRNHAIHTIVHSHCHRDNSIEIFLGDAKDVAETGEKLTREISTWCNKKIKQSILF